MKEIVEKLFSNNVFTYILTGILFANFSQELTLFQFVPYDTVTGVFIYYFMGLVIAQLGVHLLEPPLKLMGFVKTTSLKGISEFDPIDDDLQRLSESNMLFRTLCSLFIVLAMVKGAEVYAKRNEIQEETLQYGMFVVLGLLFVVSYRRQTKQLLLRTETIRESE